VSSGHALEGVFDAEHVRRRKEGLGEVRCARRETARAQEPLVAEGLARTQVEDGLKLDVQRPSLEHVDEPEAADLPAGHRQRGQVADGVPLRLSLVLGRHANLPGLRPEPLLKLGQKRHGALGQDAAGATVDLGAGPSPSKASASARSASACRRAVPSTYRAPNN
jgi:hypothetical protein